MVASCALVAFVLSNLAFVGKPKPSSFSHHLTYDSVPKYDVECIHGHVRVLFLGISAYWPDPNDCSGNKIVRPQVSVFLGMKYVPDQAIRAWMNLGPECVHKIRNHSQIIVADGWVAYYMIIMSLFVRTANH